MHSEQHSLPNIVGAAVLLLANCAWSSAWSGSSLDGQSHLASRQTGGPDLVGGKNNGLGYFEELVKVVASRLVGARRQLAEPG